MLTARILLRQALGLVAATAVLGPHPATGQCFFGDPSRVVSSDLSSGDLFGSSVALDGEFLLSGAPEDDDGGINAGAVIVHRFNGQEYVEVQKLGASNPSANQRFGSSLSADGGLLAVGSPGSGGASGAVHLFRLTSGSWSEEQVLTVPFVGTQLGASVAVSGDTVVAGAPLDSLSGAGAGAVHVFRLTTTWELEQSLRADESRGGGRFGSSMSLEGEVLVAGAPQAAVGPTAPGAAYVFRRSGSFWSQEQKLSRDGGLPGDAFGASISLSSDVVLIGVPGADDLALDLGAAVIFRLLGASFLEEQTLFAVGSFGGDAFGSAVAVEGRLAAVGAPFDSRDLGNAGAVAFFNSGAFGWLPAGRLVSGDYDFGAQLGSAVALSGPLVAAGAPRHPGGGVAAGAVQVASLDSSPGNVGGLLGPSEVLLVDGKSGGAQRRVEIGVGVPFTVSLEASPLGPATNAGYVLWVWRGALLQPLDLDVGTSNLGCTVNPTPLQPFGTPQPAFCISSSAAVLAPFCGALRRLSGPDSAPFSVLKSTGLQRPVEFVIQGILEDFGAPGADPYAVTNALLLVVNGS